MNDRSGQGRDLKAKIEGCHRTCKSQGLNPNPGCKSDAISLRQAVNQ